MRVKVEAGNFDGYCSTGMKTSHVAKFCLQLMHDVWREMAKVFSHNYWNWPKILFNDCQSEFPSHENFALDHPERKKVLINTQRKSG